jgi:hypothetical protein
MSEYQYYEFQSLERSLTNDELSAISKLSSRVELSKTKAIFTYSYGDFPGNPQQVLAKYFDAMFYIANWGTKQLMFRFPKALIPRQSLQQYCVEDCITISEIDSYIILDFLFDDENGFGWIEGDGYLDSLIDLRSLILQQDYRAVYLAWLKAITMQKIDVRELEPPVPSGLEQLSSSLKAFVEMFGVDESLLKVASKLSGSPTLISDQMRMQAINQLPKSECQTLLLRLAKGETNLSVELNQRLSKLISLPPSSEPPQRTIEQLLTESETLRKNKN